MDASNLKFDNMKVNTNHAEEYLKINNEFKPLVNIEDGAFVTTCHTDKLGNIIHVIELSNEEEKQVSSTSSFSHNLTEKFQGTVRPHEDLKEKFSLLATKIEENIDLITQLEYLTRNISIKDAKVNVQLIIQNLMHWSTELTNKSVESAFLILGPETPLLFLGFVTHILLSFEHVVIVSVDRTAAVCHLFTKLCHEVGLDNVNLVFIKDPGNIRDLDTVCIGVITEKSDLDSAVDVLLTSTNTAPWKLRRILIQESVYELFKELLTWKTNLRTVNSKNRVTYLKTKCSDVFAYDEKLLLLDYVDSEVNSPFNQQIILIEAYRTTKEAISLIKSYKAFYVSLWSSDINEANEIAYGTDAQFVWINDFANFRGPAKVSQAFYSKLDHTFSSRKIKKTNAVNDLCKLLDSWLKLNVDTRREVISKALKKYISGSVVTLETTKLVKEIQDALINPIDTFVAVSDNCMCVGLNKPVGVVVSENNCVHLFLSVINGNGVIFTNKEFWDLIANLEIAGVPVVTSEVSLKGNFKVAFDCPYQTKVVWTNFGTVYAN